jgi:hypothetical protein
MSTWNLTFLEIMNARGLALGRNLMPAFAMPITNCGMPTRPQVQYLNGIMLGFRHWMNNPHAMY